MNTDALEKDENGNYPIDLMKLVPVAEITHPASFGVYQYYKRFSFEKHKVYL